MTISIEDRDSVRTIIHDRSAARNAMDLKSADALHSAFIAFEEDPTVAVAVLWGAGGAFCAGWDLKNAASLADALDPLAEFAYPQPASCPTLPHHRWFPPSRPS